MDLPPHHITHGRFTRSLVEAPMAQQAPCQTRTEVMEVTRSMVDRRNANFLVWPLCVEVTRCSGCCNSRNMKCVPVVTSTRYLQVLKIMFVKRKEHYERAIISVEDHVSCRCQSPSSSSSSSHINHPPPPPPPLPLPTPSSHLPHQHNPPPPKTHASKADLHRHDDLKHNQHHIKKPLMGEGRQWQHGGYTQLVHWTPVHPKMEVEGRASEARRVTSIGSGEEDGANNNKGEPMERRQIMHHQHPQSDAPSPPETPTYPPRLEEKPTVPMTTSQKTVVVGSVKNNEREESGSANSGGSSGAEVAKEKDLKETSGGDLTLTGGKEGGRKFWR
ncbi:Platelet-derived growth factor subunit B [Dissostichus eleginoides]|uniref:Platelet-derived growth factor subunit B n=1 Tax=Dissostichus eleginoides TaxID=100907 RepID=A0AAD9BQB8_DISEL|nr:Platelet-derived growth factor subunit B [Dissostichus eleginoides]